MDTMIASQSQDSQTLGLDLDFSTEQLEAALHPDADYLPECFQSQPPATSSSQQPDLSFGYGLLQHVDSSSPDPDNWKFGSSCPGDDFSSQLQSVSGFDQVLENSSLLYSPASAPISPLTPSVTPTRELTSAEELLQFYMPDQPAESSPGPEISDEELLEDLDDILNSSPVEQILPNLILDFNPPADSIALALSSQYEEGPVAYELPSQPDDESSPEEKAVIVKQKQKQATRSRGKQAAAKKRQAADASGDSSAPAAKRGRKRKQSLGSDEERKRRQNAAAAKNYRIRKAEQMNKVFEEKEQVEKELEKSRKKLMAKMNERNILLKLLYEDYKTNGNHTAHTILFPPWIESWYQKQKED